MKPGPDHKEWHDWFAWFPVHIDGLTHWFCTVRRRAISKSEFTTTSWLFGGVADTVWYWEYEAK